MKISPVFKIFCLGKPKTNDNVQNNGHVYCNTLSSEEILNFAQILYVTSVEFGQLSSNVVFCISYNTDIYV
jgi:hypothetical protein